MDIHELIRHMERAERIWPDERPWTIQVLAGYLHISPSDLLKRFKEINPTLESERDTILPEDLRLLRAYCEREVDKLSGQSIEEKRREQAKARKTIQFLSTKLTELLSAKDYSKALNTYIYMLGEAGDVATPEEKATWYEEMGRLSLKIGRPPTEAARYFRSAVYALSILEDIEGIKDLIETYEEEFSSDPLHKIWEEVELSGREAIEKMAYTCES